MEKISKIKVKIVLSGKTEPMDPYETGWELAQLVERLIYTRRVTGSESCNPNISQVSTKLAFFLPWKEVSQWTL